jgi:hypothetical protein
MIKSLAAHIRQSFAKANTTIPSLAFAETTSQPPHLINQKLILFICGTYIQIFITSLHAVGRT